MSEERVTSETTPDRGRAMPEAPMPAAATAAGQPAAGQPGSGRAAGGAPVPVAAIPVAGAGRYLEDFTPGAVFEHRPGRTLTEADNIWFSLLTMNRHPMHCDHAFAAGSEFGKPLVNSGLTLAVVLGMTVDDVSAKAIANLGWTSIELVAPVFPGDTVYARSRVIAVRPSRSRPTQGIVTTFTEGYKADGTVFLRFERNSLIPKRGHGVGDSGGGD